MGLLAPSDLLLLVGSLVVVVCVMALWQWGKAL